MKSIFKLILVVFLFCSVAFAEGDMGTGGRTCPNGESTCSPASEPTDTEETKTTDEEDSVLTLIRNYLTSIFEFFEDRD